MNLNPIGEELQSYLAEKHPNYHSQFGVVTNVTPKASEVTYIGPIDEMGKILGVTLTSVRPGFGYYQGFSGIFFTLGTEKENGKTVFKIQGKKRDRLFWDICPGKECNLLKRYSMHLRKFAYVEGSFPCWVVSDQCIVWQPLSDFERLYTPIRNDQNENRKKRSSTERGTDSSADDHKKQKTLVELMFERVIIKVSL